jgi:cysteinyl-tRNA synthetase
VPPGPDGGLQDSVAAHRARFESAMDDDFNTAQALGVLFDLSRVLQSARAQVETGQLGASAFLGGVEDMAALGRALGLFQAAGRSVDVDPALRARIDSLVDLRQKARQRRNFPEADRLRDELARLGVVVEDARGGTVWKVRR